MPDVVGLVGGTGFVGRAVAGELRRRGMTVQPITAPRLRWWPDLGSVGRAGPLGDVAVDALPDGEEASLVHRLAERLAGTAVVVNAAGLPDGTAPASPALYGANALLPVLLARAARLVAVSRFVHISTAAVQGGQLLDETARTAPFSPYSRSKALGERLLLAEPPAGQVIYRPTWVHDAGRPQTRALVRLARSPVACVAGDGTAPTPQVLVSDVADAVVRLALATGPVPPVVLQPSNGMTTGLLLRLLGGRAPRHIPDRSARLVARVVGGCGQLGQQANAIARRVEMLLFGRGQVPGWLAMQGAVPALQPAAWRRLGQADPVAERV